LTSVAPASANGATTPTAVSVGTIPTTAVGVLATIPVKVTAPFNASIDTFTITAKVTSAPTGSAFNSLAQAGYAAGGGAGSSFITGVYAAGSSTPATLTFASVATTTSHLQVITPTQKNDLSPSVSTLVQANGTDGAAFTTPYTASSGTLYLKFTPDKAGSYSFLVSTKGGAPAVATATYASGDAVTSFSVSTGNVPATVSISKIGSAPTAGSTYGQLLKVTLKDSAAAAAALSSTDVLTIAPNQASTTLASVNPLTGATITSATGTAGLALTSADFITPGTAYVRITDSTATATTVVLTAVGSGTLSSSVTTTTSVTTAAASASVAITLDNPTGATRPGSGHVGYASNADTSNLTASSHTYKVTDTPASACTTDATKKITTRVQDISGDVTGVVGVTVDNGVITLTCASGVYVGSATVSGALSTDSDKFTLTVGDTGSSFVTVTSATPAVSKVTLYPTSSMKAAVGGSIALQAKVTDQFGTAYANAAVALSITGRNATTSNVNLATDANGFVTYTLTDASTSTTALTDVVKFAASNTVSGSATITYGTYAAKTITVSGGNTVAGVDGAVDVINAIYAGDGVENGAINFTATVKDANGALLAGVPVTFSVAGSGAAVTSTTQTVYTGATGTAVGTVYAWVTGKYTVTATSGAASGTATGTWASVTPSYARVVSATASGNVVTGKVVDRLGNPVQGVTLYASTTSPANIGGLFVAAATTAADGTAKWVVSNTGTVTVSAVAPTALAGTTYGQTCALAGNVDCATPGVAATAFTATTAGTATKAESGVGASFAPAGVVSASVDVTDTTSSDAVDAANEATDAANAATDAANAAAEAADAATAAAQDAQAAVADLAAQVATLIAGIKAQITSLTNLVIKIQKKVKA